MSKKLNELTQIHKKMEELMRYYRPECFAFDEKAWNKQIQKLRDREKELMKR